jgi:hypothetical protein
MMNNNDRLCLVRIRTKYGSAISESAARYGHRPEVLAGIMKRETRGGERKNFYSQSSGSWGLESRF